MQRSVVAAAGLAALIVAVALGWTTIRLQHEFRLLMARGDTAVANGRLADAIEAYSGAVTLQPRAMAPYLKRGDTYQVRGELDQALRDFRRATTLAPEASQPAERLGDVYALRGDLTEAIAAYSRFLAQDDAAARVWYKRGAAAYRANDRRRACGDARRAYALAPQLEHAEYLLGLCLAAEDQPGEAADAFRHVIDRSPGFVPAREALAAVSMHLHRFGDAADQLEALVTLDPDRPERLIILARSYAQMGRHDRAVAVLKRARARFPNATSVAEAQARLWLEGPDAGSDQRTAARIVATLAPVASDDRASSGALTVFGRALLLAGRWLDARSALDEATRRNPVDPEAYRWLTVVARHLREPAAAREADARYQALAHDDSSPDRTQRRVRLPVR